MYTKEEQDGILYSAQVKLSELAYSVALNERKGRNCKNLYEQAHKIIKIIRVLTNPNISNCLTAKEIENLYRVLYDLSGASQIPVASILSPVKRPDIILGQQGPPGPKGDKGDPGTAGADNVKVISQDGEIVVNEFVDTDGKLTWGISHNYYTPPDASISLNQSQIPEPDQNQTIMEGIQINSLEINITITKGRDNIVSASLSPASLDAAFQAALDLNEINTNGSQNIQIIQGSVINDTTYQVTVNDGTTTVNKSTSLNWVYPFYHGISDSETVAPFNDLTDLVQTKNDKSITLNGIDKYFWFGYPDSYGLLDKILDQNNFDVTNAWESSVVSVSSSGLDADWVVNYRMYRTILKTDINNSLYKFEF